MRTSLFLSVLVLALLAGCNFLGQQSVQGKWVIETIDFNTNEGGTSVSLFKNWSKGLVVNIKSDSVLVDATLGEGVFTYTVDGSELLVTPRATRVLGVEIPRSKDKQAEPIRLPYSFDAGKLVLGSDDLGQRVVLRRAE